VEPLIEVEGRAVERAKGDVAGSVDATAVERGAQHRIPGVERGVRRAVAVDPAGHGETHRRASFVDEVGERVPVERHPSCRHVEVAAGDDLEAPVAATQGPDSAVDGEGKRRKIEALRVRSGALAVVGHGGRPLGRPERRRIDGRGRADRTGTGVDARCGHVAPPGKTSACIVRELT